MVFRRFIVSSAANERLQLTPEEAYWLGVVDEVTGSDLQSDREMIEMILSTESATRNPSEMASAAVTGRNPIPRARESESPG
jgi:hypothetical protein